MLTMQHDMNAPYVCSSSFAPVILSNVNVRPDSTRSLCQRCKNDETPDYACNNTKVSGLDG